MVYKAEDTIAHDSVYEAMVLERESASKDYFGPLPIEQQYAASISGYLTMYNEGLISSLELFSQMYLKAFAKVEVLEEELENG